MSEAERLASALDMHWIEHHRCHPSDAPMCEAAAAELRRLSAELAALKAAIGEPVAWLHECRKKPSLREVSLNKTEPSLAAKGYAARPLVFGDTHPAQPAKPQP